MGSRSLSYVWDYDVDAATFEALVEGRRTCGRLDRDWAVVRLLDHAPYKEIRRLLLVRWIDAPDPGRFIGDLHALGEELLLLG